MHTVYCVFLGVFLCNYLCCTLFDGLFSTSFFATTSLEQCLENVFGLISFKQSLLFTIYGTFLGRLICSNLSCALFGRLSLQQPLLPLSGAHFLTVFAITSLSHFLENFFFSSSSFKHSLSFTTYGTFFGRVPLQQLFLHTA